MGSALTLLAGLDPAGLPQQLVNGVLLGGIYALLALGYTMVYGVLRLINFAHGEVFMLGAYTSLFVSWALGFSPEAMKSGSHQSNPMNLVIMILVSMTVCALVGVVIELFAYRPMRGSSRIASLITAIGVSLLLQYGGQLFLPTSPPPSISDKVNPYSGSWEIPLKSADASLVAALAKARTEAKESQAEIDRQHINRFDTNLPPAQAALITTVETSERQVHDLEAKINNSSVKINLRYGQLIMLGSTIVLMLLLRHLVLKTPIGRAMRAVSHDFDSASLMGVNVNQIVTLTFMIGSALAGAGAMMYATLGDSPALNTFYGSLPGVKAFVAAVLGGIGNIPGAVLGGLLMGVAENLVVWAGYSQYKDAVAFVILIAVLLLKPGGIMGSSKVEKV
ncbi:MAG: branched-chain amino acid ABC transporter permease [Armatimonadetes bacterium]|nr:branched-chain amino acid ABC transporter permease [Armatimonadota bacterium]